MNKQLIEYKVKSPKWWKGIAFTFFMGSAFAGLIYADFLQEGSLVRMGFAILVSLLTLAIGLNQDVKWWFKGVRKVQINGGRITLTLRDNKVEVQADRASIRSKRESNDAIGRVWITLPRGKRRHIKFDLWDQVGKDAFEYLETRGTKIGT